MSLVWAFSRNEKNCTNSSGWKQSPFLVCILFLLQQHAHQKSQHRLIPQSQPLAGFPAGPALHFSLQLFVIPSYLNAIYKVCYFLSSMPLKIMSNKMKLKTNLSGILQETCPSSLPHCLSLSAFISNFNASLSQTIQVKLFDRYSESHVP